MSQGFFSEEKLGFRQIWQQNHGNFLLAFTGLLLIIGGIILLWPKKEKPRVGADILADNGIPLIEEESSEVDTNTSTEAPNPDSPARQTVLRIRVIGMDSDEGEVRIAAYTDPAFFNQPESTSLKTAIPAKKDVQWDLIIPTGANIALSVYHDANSNGKLDRNLIGIPSEKYGFSRGARSQTGPPPFSEASFIAEPGIIDVPIEIW